MDGMDDASARSMTSCPQATASRLPECLMKVPYRRTGESACVLHVVETQGWAHFPGDFLLRAVRSGVAAVSSRVVSSSPRFGVSTT